VAVTELLLQSYATSNMIRENKIFQLDSFLQSSDHATSGTKSLDGCIFEYVKSGIIAPEEGLKIANYPDALKRLISELPEDA
jgi:Tfp pilus assembly pilus retraction ATPase PilT